jgi:hypothetical protein
MSAFWLPFLISNVLALTLLGVCYQWKNAGRIAFGIIFLAAGSINTFTALAEPTAYLNYGEMTPVKLYQDFIAGPFARYTTLFVLLIASGQVLMGLGFLIKGKLLKPAVIGGIVFLLAISPLGMGSAFPATLIMALAVGLLLWEKPKRKKSKPQLT